MNGWVSWLDLLQNILKYLQYKIWKMEKSEVVIGPLTLLVSGQPPSFSNLETVQQLKANLYATTWQIYEHLTLHS